MTLNFENRMRNTLLAKVTQNPWHTIVIGVAGLAFIVIAIALAGGEVSAGLLKFSFRGVLNQDRPAIPTAPASVHPEDRRGAVPTSPATSTADSPDAPGMSEPPKSPQTPSQDLPKLAAPIVAATSELVVPLGRSVHDATKLLDGAKYRWKIAEGGMILEYSQSTFGTDNWTVEERFVDDRATSATLTLDTEASETIELLSSRWSQRFDPIRDLCYGPRYLAMKRDWDNNMQLLDGRIDADDVDITQRMSADESPPCPSNLECEPGNWFSRRADWTYRVPNLWYVFVSMQKSSFVRDQGPDEHRRFTYRRDRCAAKVTYTLDSSVRPSQIELLP